MHTHNHHLFPHDSPITPSLIPHHSFLIRMLLILCHSIHHLLVLIVVVFFVVSFIFIGSFVAFAFETVAFVEGGEGLDLCFEGERCEAFCYSLLDLY